MATNKQKNVAKKDVKKVQEHRQETTPKQHALAQPESSQRTRPGTKGEDDYYRINVRPKEEFTTFRYHDIGQKGHLQRLAGKRSSGSWDTQSWLINKHDAHLRGESLVADTKDAKDLLAKLGSPPRHVKGDVFEAKDRPNVPERKKPTAAQKRAWMENIKKAQAARWKIKAK